MADEQDKSVAIRIFAHAVLIIGGVVIFIPFLWMISTSLKGWLQIPQKIGVAGDNTQGIPYMTNMGLLVKDFFPNPIKWENYKIALEMFPFFRYLWNTSYITIWVIVGTLLSNSMVAYGFARVHFPRKNTIFLIYLATLIIPTGGVFIPTYILWAKVFRAIDTYVPLIAPAFFASPFMVFLMRQFFMTIPEGLADASRIDGAHEFTIYFRVMLPLIKPVIAVLIIFTFMGSWNQFFEPLIFLNSQKKWTLSLALAMFAQGGVKNLNLNIINYQMVVAFIMAVPPLIIFYFSQRAFMKGIVLTGITGR